MRFISNIKSIKVIDDNLRVYEFSKPINFFNEVGQYIWVEIEDVGRSPMAIASSTDENNIILAVRRWGVVTEKLFEMKEGEPIFMDGPHGTFFSPQLMNKKLYLFAAGSGITPIRSLVNSSCIVEQTTLFYGAKTEDQLLFDQEFREKQIKYIPFVSQASDNWKGKRGHVTEAIGEFEFDVAAICFICGPKQMISSVSNKLLEIGFKEENIYLSIEKYDGDGNVVGPIVKLNHPELDFL